MRPCIWYCPIASLSHDHNTTHFSICNNCYPRGCIFVGHGLSQDFRIINICIPPNQIIDTAEIYHQFNQRYISLRYLTNFVLGRDMQQEVHDSIEDARAANELYRKALSLKHDGKFDEYLMNLYAHGHSTQFKLGIAK